MDPILKTDAKWLGQRIKALREKQGLTQEELANKLGYSNKSAIAHIENGRNMPSGVRFAKMAKVLGVTTDDLLDDSDLYKLKDVLQANALKEIHMEDDKLRQAAKEQTIAFEEITTDKDFVDLVLCSPATREIVIVVERLPEREQWRILGRLEAYVENYKKDKK